MSDDTVKTKTPLHDRLVELRERTAELRRGARKIEQDAGEAMRAVQAMRGEINELRARELAGDTGGNVKSAEARLRKAQKVADEGWEDRLAVARRAVALSEGQVSAFIAQNVSGLLDESRPAAVAARDRVVAALEEIDAAARGWYGEAQRVGALVNAVQIGASRAIPELGLERLRSAVSDALGSELPAPLPTTATGVWIAPEDDPDPEVREAARDRITQGRAA